MKVMFEQDPNRIVNAIWAGLRLSQSMRRRPPPPPIGVASNILRMTILKLLHLHRRLRTRLYGLQTYFCNGPKNFLHQPGNISKILLMQRQFVVSHRNAILQKAQGS
jgi:hypothetical protein